MRLVYQNARDVIIWFGPSSDHIDSLFDWMNRLDRHIPRYLTVLVHIRRLPGNMGGNG